MPRTINIVDIIECCRNTEGTIRFGLSNPISRSDFDAIHHEMMRSGIKSIIRVEGNTITFTRTR